jgi:hypothetical protein
MLIGLHILARGEDDAVKIIFGIIVVVVWIVSAIASQLKKQKQQQKKEADWERILREQTQGTPPQSQQQTPPVLRPQPQRTVPPPTPSRPRPVPQAKKRSVPKQRPSPPRPVSRPQSPPPRQVPAMARTEESDTHAVLTRQAPAAPVQPLRPPPSLTTESLARWLRPATLRQQFILTEILQPPLSLRDQR